MYIRNKEKSYDGFDFETMTKLALWANGKKMLPFKCKQCGEKYYLITKKGMVGKNNVGAKSFICGECGNENSANIPKD